jgi:hypothetical protein
MFVLTVFRMWLILILTRECFNFKFFMGGFLVTVLHGRFHFNHSPCVVPFQQLSVGGYNCAVLRRLFEFNRFT